MVLDAKPRTVAPLSSRLGAAALALSTVSLLVAPWIADADDSDANLYRVIVRNLLQDDAWLSLRYLESVYPQFHEHLPFGFWPFAVGARLFRFWGEAGQTFGVHSVAAAFTVGTLTLSAWVARRLAGGSTSAAVWTLLVLGLNPSFMVYGALPRLDVPLCFVSTLSIVPVLVRSSSARLWFVAGLAAAAGVAIKGPFGVLPLAAAGTAQLLCRDVRRFRLAAGVGVLALLPTTAFLFWDWLHHGPWFEGYVRRQLFASASGARRDGSFAVVFPFRSVVSRFWPGLPFVVVSVVRSIFESRRLPSTAPRPPGAPVGWTALILLVLLTLPARKVWNHVLIAYPVLAIFVGVELSRWKPMPIRSLQTRPAFAGGALILACVLCAGIVFGRPAFLLPPAPRACREFEDVLKTLPPGAAVAVRSASPWATIACLARRYRLQPRRAEEGRPTDAAWMLVSREGSSDMPEGWRIFREGRDALLLSR